MLNSPINSLNDLKSLRSAPTLDEVQRKNLSAELYTNMNNADWFTIGIMASSSKVAILVVREMENLFNWSEMKVIDKPEENGPVFLKANQKTGDIYVRIEYGLGEGILLSCQHNADNKNADTFGPLPLDFFKI